MRHIEAIRVTTGMASMALLTGLMQGALERKPHTARMSSAGKAAVHLERPKRRTARPGTTTATCSSFAIFLQSMTN